jgi:hypothetical protein
MRVVRPSSVEEYSFWYLRREARKGDRRPIPAGPEKQVQVMWERHGQGKMRTWFTDTTRWHIVLLEANDLANLVFLECAWTKREGLVVPGRKNYRLLDRVADNAMRVRYLARSSAHKHRAYYDALVSGSLRLEGEECVAICSAEDSEIQTNPRALYYLLDGVGRCLPYMVLTKEGAVEYTPVEAFLAARSAT